MTPEELARLQRLFLMETETNSAAVIALEFETLKREIADYLAKNLEGDNSANNLASLYERNFLNRALRIIETGIEKISNPFSRIVARAQSRVIKFASDSLKKFLTKKIAFETSIFAVDKESIAQLVGRTQTGMPLSRAFADLKTPVAESAKKSLIEGFSLGESNQQIAKRINDITEVGKVRAFAQARTETNESYRAASREFFRAGKIQTYTWISAKDLNTCPICWSLHGQIFNSDKKIFSHVNCRCALVPNVPGAAQITRGRDDFERLTDAQKKVILGTKRFELYQNGRAFDSFVGVKNTEFGEIRIVKNLTDLD